MLDSLVGWFLLVLYPIFVTLKASTGYMLGRNGAKRKLAVWMKFWAIALVFKVVELLLPLRLIYWVAKFTAIMYVASKMRVNLEVDDVVARGNRFLNEEGPIIAEAIRVHVTQAYVKLRVMMAEAQQAGLAARNERLQAIARTTPTIATANVNDLGAVPATQSTLHDSASILAAIEARRRLLEAELAALPNLRAAVNAQPGSSGSGSGVQGAMASETSILPVD